MSEGIIQIKRGTTPTITAIIPEDIPLEDVVNIWVSIGQGERMAVPTIDKIMKDCTIDLENKKVSVMLTQEETLRLIPTQSTGRMYNLPTYIEISLKMESGDVIKSKREMITVLDVVKEGFM